MPSAPSRGSGLSRKQAFTIGGREGLESVALQICRGKTSSGTPCRHQRQLTPTRQSPSRISRCETPRHAPRCLRPQRSRGKTSSGGTVRGHCHDTPCYTYVHAGLSASGLNPPCSLGKVECNGDDDDDDDGQRIEVCLPTRVLIQSINEKEMTHNAIRKSVSEIDAGLTDSAFTFSPFFISFNFVLLCFDFSFLHTSKSFSSSFRRLFQHVSSSHRLS